MKIRTTLLALLAIMSLFILNMVMPLAYAEPDESTPAITADAVESEVPRDAEEVTQSPTTVDIPESPTPTEEQPPAEPEVNEPVVDTVPSKLTIHLGAHWADTEFELSTKDGAFPGAITVDDKGDMHLEIPAGDITLTILNRSVTPPVPVTAAEEQEGTPTPATSIEPTEQLEESGSGDAGIPIIHIVLFAGGSVLCIGFLIYFFVRRRHKDEYYEYEDDDYDDE